MKINLTALLSLLIIFYACSTASKSVEPATAPTGETEWIPLFNGKDLSGWTPHGDAHWSVNDGVLSGEGGRGHIYTNRELKNFEVKGEFRITEKGKSANSGLYFRAHPPKDDPDAFPRGYEAQICNSQDAYTGWLWKPGTPTGKASALLTKDGEWFSLRVKAIGSDIQIWVKDQLVMTHRDKEYKQGFFAIQCHNDSMLTEARALYYRELK
jgi:Domain of Unknown Function (DUF1080)